MDLIKSGFQWGGKPDGIYSLTYKFATKQYLSSNPRTNSLKT